MGIVTSVEIAPGLSMPFKPMRLRAGDPLRTKSQIKAVLDDLGNDDLLIRPTLKGQRVCLAVVDRSVFIVDEEGRFVTKPPTNGRDFLKLKNNTCFDGYIYDGAFYAAECLAIMGRSLVYKPAAEREVEAYMETRFLNHAWKFRRPSSKFVRAAQGNLPEVQGLVLKDYQGIYAMLSSAGAKTAIKRLW